MAVSSKWFLRSAPAPVYTYIIHTVIIHKNTYLQVRTYTYICPRRDDVSSRTDILISVREIVIGSKIGLTLLFVFLKTYVLMRILITNDLQKTATLYRLCRRRFANRREFFHTFEMSYNPKDHRAVPVGENSTFRTGDRVIVQMSAADRVLKMPRNRVLQY